MSKELADLLFPNVSADTEEIFNRYPRRQLPIGAMVTRIAPSPTGFLHIGTLYAAFISQKLAKQSDGIFYIRLEDTDGKRKVEGASESIIAELKACGITADEGFREDGTQEGDYKPYIQSERKIIYQTFAKQLVTKGLAYPCFCGKEELDAVRASQKEQKLDIGYYGGWAKCRLLALGDIKNKINQKIPFVIRLKSNESEEKIVYKDLFKGHLEFTSENKDTIIIKTDGLPTYHFAHCIDDTLMGTTHVIRGDEWIASLPVHRQLFQTMGFKQPVYGHIAPIVKIEGTTKRKYSKRRDMDGLASYFLKEGYPIDGLHEYFLTLANSAFEQWRMNNPGVGRSEYKIDIANLSSSGAVLDKNKLRDICRNTISLYSTDEIFNLLYYWSEKYDSELFKLLQDKQYSKAILSIGRSQANPRKDIEIYSDVKNTYSYFFDERFMCKNTMPLMLAKIPQEASLQFANEYLSTYNHADNKEVWFGKLKSAAIAAGFCADKKAYKENKAAYPGSVSDAASLIRIALTNRAESPDIYDIQQVMGETRVKQRIKQYLCTVLNWLPDQYI